MIRYAEKEKQRGEELEMQWSVGREILALTYNINRGKGKPAMKGTDFINLSTDKKKVKETQKLSPEEVERKFGKKLTDKIK